MLLARLQYPIADPSQPWSVCLHAGSSGAVPTEPRSWGRAYRRAAAPCWDSQAAGLESCEQRLSSLLKPAELRGAPRDQPKLLLIHPLTWQAELPCCRARAGSIAQAVSVLFCFHFTCFIFIFARTEGLCLEFCCLGWIFAGFLWCPSHSTLVSAPQQRLLLLGRDLMLKKLLN